MSTLDSRESLPDTAKDHAKPSSRQSPAWLSHVKPCVHLLGISLPWEFSSQQRLG